MAAVGGPAAGAECEGKSIHSPTYCTKVCFKAATVAGDLLINGVDIGPLAVAVDPTGRVAQLVGAINAKSAQTGVTATVNTTSALKIDFAAVDGRNITTTATATAVSGGLAGVVLANDTTTTAKLKITSATGESAVVVTGVIDILF